MLVIATIIITAAYVGYYEWQGSVSSPEDHEAEGEAHKTIPNTYSILKQNIIINVLR